MLTLYKSLVMSRLDYAPQLWSPYLLKHIYLIEKVQRAFTKHISGMCFLSSSKCLELRKLYSLQRRRERYGIIYVWKIVEGLVPNLSDPISIFDRRGRTCIVCHSGAGRLGTLKYNSFRGRSIRMFNRLPKAIFMLSSCSVVGFKTPILRTLWIFPAGLDSIIVWAVGIAYMVVTMWMTWRPIRCS